MNEKRLDEWDVALTEFMIAYKKCEHNTTCFTPSFIIFGVEARIPSEILQGLPEMARTPAAYAFVR